MKTAIIHGVTVHLPTFHLLRDIVGADTAHRISVAVAATKKVRDRIAGFTHDGVGTYVITLGLHDGGPEIARFASGADTRSLVEAFNAMIAKEEAKPKSLAAIAREWKAANAPTEVRG